MAEILFTSGSSSLPKGVMLSHNNIIANTGSIVQYLDLSDKDIMMVILPFYYCYGLSLLHTHIRAGGSLVLNNNFIFLGSTFQDLNRYRCTGFAGVPSHFQIMLKNSEEFKKTTFPYLRYVTQAGGQLPNLFINEFNLIFPNICFVVMYGQTEATARLSYLPPAMLKKKMGSVGKGIPGVELKVVNDSGNPIVPGERGEIIARGDNIMIGYFDDPRMTSDTIRDGWLYTGDLATVDDEGYLYIIGRKKEMIKVGGYRISPREIEEVILGMKGVVDCSAEGTSDPLNGEAIKVTVFLNQYGSSLSVEDIKSFCAAKLQIFKVPKEVILKDTIQLSPTGKKVKSIKDIS
jgi:long-chain acyl-CoA synthetase